MAVDICYIVSHGFASRMLTQTDLLGRLRQRGLSVAVIAPDAEDPELSAYCRERGIRLEEFRPQPGLFNDDYLFKRNYFLEDIRANPALWEKHLAATRFHQARNPFKRLRPHWYYFLHRLIPRFPAIRRRFKANERRFLNSPDAERLIATLAPRKLISTYPVTLAEAILLHYGNRHADVETWIHLLSWDNITCKGRFVETADRYIAWGPIMRDELMTLYGVPADRIAECGVPHFDLHLDPRVAPLRPGILSALGLDPARPYLLFAMSSPRFAPNEIDLVEWLAGKVGEGAFGDMQLLVRPHPQNVIGNLGDVSWLPRLRTLATQRDVAVAFPKLVTSKMRWSMQHDDMIELVASLSGATTVLNSGSTVSIDALMHDRPVVLTSFDADRKRDYWDSARRLIDYPHLKKLVGLGGVRVAKDLSQLEQVIRDILSSPDSDRAQRAIAVQQECSARDGGATERVVQLLSAAHDASVAAASHRP